MYKIVYCVLFITFSYTGICQDSISYYTIESFQGEYEELENYNSIAIETMGAFSWTKRFELSFNFPYYDTVYTHLYGDESATFYFENSDDFSMHLLAYPYKWDNVTDTVNIESDVRYSTVTKNNQSALVVQYTKVRLITDTTVEEFDSYINFQTWFYENGDIEIRFGDINLDSSNVYVHGEGFYLTFADTVLPAGPNVGLTHPTDDSESIGLIGSFNDIEIVDFIGSLNTLPPKGWVIRFSKKAISDAPNQIAQEVKLFPIPSKNFINFNTRKNIDKISLYSITGKLLISKDYNARGLDISSLPNGIYFLDIIIDGTHVRKKIIKQ